MIVVADTSPLNYLVQLGLPDVLQEIYGRVLVPQAVLTEMQHRDAPSEVRVWAGDPPSWLERTSVRQVDATLAAELGRGEREAISLAVELRADILLIDELAGRREAEARKLLVTGTVAVLLQASLRGRCEFPEALEQLRHRGFWLSSAFQRMMMTRYQTLSRRDRGAI